MPTRPAEDDKTIDDDIAAIYKCWGRRNQDHWRVAEAVLRGSRAYMDDSSRRYVISMLNSLQAQSPQLFTHVRLPMAPSESRGSDTAHSASHDDGNASVTGSTDMHNAGVLSSRACGGRLVLKSTSAGSSMHHSSRGPAANR